MRCQRAQRLMTAAVDGELPPRRRAAVDRHLAACAACRREMAGTEAILSAVAALPSEAPVPAGLAAATLRRVRSAAEGEGRTRGWPWLGLPAFAAAAAVAVAVVIGGLRSAEPPAGPVAERIVRAPADAPAVETAPIPAAPQRLAAARTAPPPAPPPAATPDVTPAEAAPPAWPPRDLARAPELFVDLPIVRNLEKLEHFESIRTTTVDDETGGRSGRREHSG